jgi:hypothetical protein
MSAATTYPADEVLAHIDDSPNETGVEVAVELHVSTKAVTRHLKCRPSDLRAAARRLGMVPGITVSRTPTGQPIVRSLWQAAWLPELEVELGRADAPEIADLCGLEGTDDRSRNDPRSPATDRSNQHQLTRKGARHEQQ